MLHAELAHKFSHVGSAEAKESRGFVHLYVRQGISFDCITLHADSPCVCAKVSLKEQGEDVLHAKLMELYSLGQQNNWTVGVEKLQ